MRKAIDLCTSDAYFNYSRHYTDIFQQDQRVHQVLQNKKIFTKLAKIMVTKVCIILQLKHKPLINSIINQIRKSKKDLIFIIFHLNLFYRDPGVFTCLITQQAELSDDQRESPV